MSAEYTHVLYAVGVVIALIVGIAKFKLNPFLALMLGALVLGLVSGLGVPQTVKAFEIGFGDTLSDTGPVIGLGCLLGAVLSATGGATRIADALVSRSPRALIPLAIAVAALLIGLPNLFDVSFVMLVPLSYALASRAKMHVLALGLPLAAGLYTAHGLLPPHPAPTAAVAAYHANFGLTLAWGLLVAIPTVLICGPLFARFASRRFTPAPHVSRTDPAPDNASEGEGKRAASLTGSLVVVLLPPVLLVVGALGVERTHPGSVLHTVFEFCANPVITLLLALLMALFVLGPRSHTSIAALQREGSAALKSVGPVLLIIGAGGGLAQMLSETGVSHVVVDLAHGWQLPLIPLAWSVAALLRVCLGSATVASVTAAGIVAPIAAASPGVSAELLVLATASGAVMLSHVNDSGFWLFKEYFHLSVKQTFKTWTFMLSLQSVIGLGCTWALAEMVG